MQRRIKAGLLASVLLVVVLMTGCGGDDEGTSADDGGSLAERVARLEEGQRVINQYIGGHTQQHAQGGVQQSGSAQPSTNGVSQPTYSLIGFDAAYGGCSDRERS